MKKEIEFVNTCDRIAGILSELGDIVTSIRANFDEEHVQDPNLTFEIIDYSLDLATSRARSFLAYKQRSKREWTLKKYTEYARDTVLDFFREFENPFLRSRRWGKRIKELLRELSKECGEFEKLLEEMGEKKE